MTQIPYQEIDDVAEDDEATTLESVARQDLKITVNGKKVVEQQVMNP